MFITSIFLLLIKLLLYLLLFLLYRKTVVNLAVAEGPAVQGIYQQVIRDFPDLIGGAGRMWGSKNRRYVNRKHNSFSYKFFIL